MKFTLLTFFSLILAIQGYSQINSDKIINGTIIKQVCSPYVLLIFIDTNNAPKKCEHIIVIQHHWKRFDSLSGKCQIKIRSKTISILNDNVNYTWTIKEDINNIQGDVIYRNLIGLGINSGNFNITDENFIHDFIKSYNPKL